MPAKCSRTFDLGCFDCGQSSVAIPVLATFAGTYSARFRYIGTEIRKDFTGEAGTTILIPINGLNEDFTHYFYVLDPNGDRVTYDNGLVHDCFRFTIHPSVIGESAEFVDASVLTCDNLKDAEKGLTEEQLLDCVLPVYDFADPDTLDALTPQQEIDLAAAFGGGAAPDPYFPLAIGTP